MYKFVSLILVALLVVGGGFYAYERYNNNKIRRSLNNEIAKLEGIVQETDTAVSRRGVELNDLKSENKELQRKIKDRDEDIVSLNKIVLKWKDKYIKIENAKEVVIDKDGSEVVELGNACKECVFSGRRFKVYYDHVEDYLRIKGYTLTNPPYGEVEIKWLRDLKINLILTKNEDNIFRIYMDSKSSDIVPTELNLTVDPSVFELRWYERLATGMDLSIGAGFLTSVRGYVQVFDDWLVGPMFSYTFDGKDFRKYYGVSTVWFPFR